MQTWVPAATHVSLMLAIGSYALVKERQESGCRGWSATRRQCADEDSVYVRGTAPEPGDTPADIKRKLVSILSYHEKGGVWKRCFLLAAALAYLAWVVQRAATPGWAPLLLHLVFFCILYFWFNYLNYHHFRLLKNHGEALLAKLHCGLGARDFTSDGEGGDSGGGDELGDGEGGGEGGGGEGGGGLGDGPCMSAYKLSLMRQAPR